MLRAVLDSNVVLAADRATNPLSPNREVLHRWAVGEFIWLVATDIVAEYAEKLLDKGNSPADVEAFVLGFFYWRRTSKSASSTSATIRWIPTTPFSCSAPSMALRHIS